MTERQGSHQSPPMPPALAVIIPHYNDTTRLERCLAALEQEGRDQVEVIVADNGSDLDLADLSRRFPELRIVTEARKGAGLARNAGVADTTAPWLAFIDADCVADAGWLLRALSIARTESDVVTGGRVDLFDETAPPRTGAEAFEAVFAFRMERYLEEEGFLGAGNLVLSRAAFEQAGPFEGGVSEDKEWSQRAAARGLRLAYDAALIVSHPSRSDWPALARKWRRLTAEEFALRQSRGQSRVAWALKALAMPLSILAHAPRVLTHGDLTGLEKVRALATLVRLRLCRMVWMLRLL